MEITNEYFKQRLENYKAKVLEKRLQPEFLEFDLDFADIREHVNKVSFAISDEQHLDDLIKVYERYFQDQESQKEVNKYKQHSSATKLTSEKEKTESITPGQGMDDDVINPPSQEDFQDMQK